MADQPTPIYATRARFKGGGPDDDSAMGLVRRLLDEVSTLFRQEIALASAEISRSISGAKAGVGSIATGGAVVFAGFLMLLEALVLGLSELMRPWIAALIVGIVVAAIGLILLKAGSRKLEPDMLRPKRTEESLRRAKELIERRTQ
jgi:hypothetical protein